MISNVLQSIVGAPDDISSWHGIGLAGWSSCDPSQIVHEPDFTASGSSIESLDSHPPSAVASGRLQVLQVDRASFVAKQRPCRLCVARQVTICRASGPAQPEGNDVRLQQHSCTCRLYLPRSTALITFVSTVCKPTQA